jgi:hypothetical protein
MIRIIKHTIIPIYYTIVVYTKDIINTHNTGDKYEYTTRPS